MWLGGKCQAAAALPLGKDPVHIVGGGIYVGKCFTAELRIGKFTDLHGKKQ